MDDDFIQIQMETQASTPFIHDVPAGYWASNLSPTHPFSEAQHSGDWSVGGQTQMGMGGRSRLSPFSSPIHVRGGVLALGSERESLTNIWLRQLL